MRTSLGRQGEGEGGDDTRHSWSTPWVSFNICYQCNTTPLENEITLLITTAQRMRNCASSTHFHTTYLICIH